MPFIEAKKSMSLRILSFRIEGATWRVAQTPKGYFYRDPSGISEWKTGIPEGVTSEIVEGTFQQFSSDDASLLPGQLTFKTTYRIGQSNAECFVFSSAHGDIFSVKIPPATFIALQKVFPSQSFPRMRVARIVIQQALESGFPDVELLPDSPLFEQIKQKISRPIP